MIKLGNRTTEYIEAIAEYQNITKAAESLFISQPALSRFLNDLERDLQLKLFNRYNNKYQLTFEGERFLFYAKQINSLNRQLEEELDNILAKEYGRLRFSIPSHRSPTVLPSLLPKFYKMHPFVKLEISEVTSREQKGQLLNGETDIALLIDEIDHPDIQTSLIAKEDVLLAIPQGHAMFKKGCKNPNKECPVISLDKFTNDCYILPPEGQHTRIVANKIFNELEIEPNVRLYTRNMETMLKLTSNDLGICLVSSSYAKYIKTERPLSFFKIDSKYAYSYLLAAYMKNTFRPKYANDFLELLKAHEF